MEAISAGSQSPTRTREYLLRMGSLTGPGVEIMVTMTSTKKCPYCVEDIQQEAIKCKHCGTWLATPAVPPPYLGPTGDGDDPYLGDGWAPPRRFTRSATDVMWAGVLGGLGRYLEIDPTWLRIAFAVATLFTGFFPGFALYIVLWAIVPDESRVAKGS